MTETQETKGCGGPALTNLSVVFLCCLHPADADAGEWGMSSTFAPTGQSMLGSVSSSSMRLAFLPGLTKASQSHKVDAKRVWCMQVSAGIPASQIVWHCGTGDI